MRYIMKSQVSLFRYSFFHKYDSKQVMCLPVCFVAWTNAVISIPYVWLTTDDGSSLWSWKGMFVGVCAGLQSAAAAAVAAAGSAAGVGNGFSSLANTLAAGYGNNSLGTIGSPALGSLGSGILSK